MLKFPETGKVKTRLAAELGNCPGFTDSARKRDRSIGTVPVMAQEQAARLYQEIAEQVVDATAPRRGSYQRAVFFAPATGRERFAAWLPGEMLMPQRGRELGKRMLFVIEDLFALGADKAVITGGDILNLDSAIIRRAFRLLERNDVVIGPAEDGGYYLIGMKKLHPRLFGRMPWGTEKVFRMTVAAAERLGLRYAFLPELSDVDRADDIFIVKKRHPQSRGR